jgi:hypothetical protein
MVICVAVATGKYGSVSNTHWAQDNLFNPRPTGTRTFFDQPCLNVLKKSGLVRQAASCVFTLCSGHFNPVILSPGRFVPWLFHPLVISSPGHFIPQSFHPLVISSPGHFIPQSFHLPVILGIIIRALVQ